MADLRTPIGFIGIGRMGEPMARCLRQAGYDLLLLDYDAARSSAVAEALGAQAAASADDLAGRCEIIITMLPTSDSVAAALSEQALRQMRPGALVIDMTSGVPAKTLKLAARVAAAGGALVDAPVSGGVSRAGTGDLSIMFGGDEALLERVKPILLAMGSTVTRTGGVGTAHAMKALNNLVSAGGFLIGVEAMLIGKKFGLEPEMMVDVLNASTGANNSTQKKFKQFVLSRAFNSGFGLDLMVKDLTIAVDMADDEQLNVPFASQCRALWADAVNELGSGKDHTELARFSEKLAGIALEREA